jgi:2-keto-3-deoxy-6-phosphogluconate aldolase
MVSGGVARDQISSYLDLGVRSVALGRALMPTSLVEASDWAGLEQHARQFRSGLFEA